MTRCLLLALLLLPTTTAFSFAEDPAHFGVSRTIERREPARDEIVSVTLDSDVYARTRPGYADLRLFDAAGQEVPLQLIQDRATRSSEVRHPCPSRIVSLKERDDGSLEIIAALDAESGPAAGLVIRTPLKDFERRLQVFGRRADADWQSLVAEATIFDYSRFMDVSQREVALPENRAREFRIVIDSVTDEVQSHFREVTRQLGGQETVGETERTQLRDRPLRIDRIDFFQIEHREGVAASVERAYPVGSFSAEQNAKDKTTVITVHSQNEPLTELTIAAATPNFVRQATVQVPVKAHGETGWRDIATAEISAIHFKGFERQRLSISFPEQRQQEYRIVIRNNDNPPLSIIGVTARGNQYVLRFLAQPNLEYRLCYDSATAKQPTYDTSAIMTMLAGKYTPSAGTLGPAQDHIVEPAPAGGHWIDSRLAFGVAIAILVVVIAAVVYRAAQRVETLPSNPQS